METNNKSLEQVIKTVNDSLDAVLSYSQKNDYAGFNKYDALASPILLPLSFGNKNLRLFYSQAIMRSPLNLRPLFAIPRTRNPKGIALFAMTYLNLYLARKSEKYLQKAEELLDWLAQNQSTGFPGNSWGYQYPWQDVGFFAPPNLPNRVVSYFVGTAFLNAYEITGKSLYLNYAIGVKDFLIQAPKVLYEDDKMKCLSYVPDESINWVVMDVSALCGAFCARLAHFTNDKSLIEEARKLISYVVDKQTDYGAWYYTHPPTANRLKMHDNYHTGYILDAILDYLDFSGDDSFLGNYHRGLQYYLENLFLADGTPKWMNNKIYPIDVHGSAQGIITFLKAGRFNRQNEEFAYRIAEWAINNMQNKQEGFFYYQKGRFFKKPFTIMHWSNGWMAIAMSEIIRKYYAENRATTN
ncbi:MAG: hypothetical protein KBG36_02060 [Candidatus Marinimicrobia bacterium]|nr:hypothetical protein [Candidatus Neomarinimicrobiota bacterium]